MATTPITDVEIPSFWQGGDCDGRTSASTFCVDCGTFQCESQEHHKQILLAETPCRQYCDGKNWATIHCVPCGKAMCVACDRKMHTTSHEDHHRFSFQRPRIRADRSGASDEEDAADNLSSAVRHGRGSSHSTSEKIKVLSSSSRRRPRQQLLEPPSLEPDESVVVHDLPPDDRWKGALRLNHEYLRCKIRMRDALPGFHIFLTPVEYARVKGCANNLDKVDEFVDILLTKEKWHFEEFLVALWKQDYADMAAKLAEEAGVALDVPSDVTMPVDKDVSLTARAGIPKYNKDAKEEKNTLYYPSIEPLHDAFYEGVIIPFESFVIESTDAEFQQLMRRCEKVIRRKEHLIACKVHLPIKRRQFLRDLQHKYGLWKDALEYQLLREVIMELRDKSLTQRLEQYEVLLRKEGNTILMQCQREFRKCPDLCLKLKAAHNTALGTLCRLKSFLINDVGLKDTSFAGFREGCIELFFRISSESASTALDPLCSHAFRSKLLSMGVRRVTLSGHWVIDTNTGHVVFLQSPESLTDHDPEDSTADVTPSTEMTASITGHSGRPSDLEDVHSCKRVKLNPEEEDTPVFQSSHNIEWQAAAEFQPYHKVERQAAEGDSSLLQSESSQSCVADKGTSDDEETMEDGMCQPTKVAASYISILDQAWVQEKVKSIDKVLEELGRKLQEAIKRLQKDQEEEAKRHRKIPEKEKVRRRYQTLDEERSLKLQEEVERLQKDQEEEAKRHRKLLQEKVKRLQKLQERVKRLQKCVDSIGEFSWKDRKEKVKRLQKLLQEKVKRLQKLQEEVKRLQKVLEEEEAKRHRKLQEEAKRLQKDQEEEAKRHRKEQEEAKRLRTRGRFVLGLSLLDEFYCKFQEEEEEEEEEEEAERRRKLQLHVAQSVGSAGQPLEKRVLMECEKSFYKEVAVMEVYRELCQKHVIPQTVADKITKSHSVEEARGYLFDHMRDYGTLATLKAFCDVITSEKYDGFPEMQEFGTEMRRRLEQEVALPTGPAFPGPPQPTPVRGIPLPPPLPTPSVVPDAGVTTPLPTATPPPPDTADIIEALNHQLDARWRHFGTFLCVDYQTMESIETSTCGKPEDCMLDLLGRWTSNQAGTGTLPRTWQTVVEAVNKTEFRAI